MIHDIHYDACGFEVIQTFDGGYCIVGRTGDYKSDDIFIIKTDSNGNKIFEKTYDIGAYDYGCSIKQTSDEGFIIVGYSLQELTNDRMCLLKTDKNGILQWNKIFKLRGRYCQGYSLQITDDNGYIITGCAKPNRKADYNIWLLKTDENGTVLWENTFGGEYKGEGRSIQISDDGGYIITGCCNYKAVLIITDSKGEIEWSKTYGGQYFDCAYSVQQTNDGGYILTGCHQVSHKGYTDLFVLKTDSEGNAPPFGDSRHNVNMFGYRTTINSYLLRLFDMFPILQRILSFIK